MPKALEWDKIGEKLYETGVKECALFVQDSTGAYPKGVAWNGITAINESPSGAEKTKLYADDAVYANLISAEEYGLTIEAYMYPDEFGECDGSAEIAKGITIGQQNRKTFGIVYKTTIGNDVDNNNYGYKLHFVYGCIASPSEKSRSTINDSPEAANFSWEISATPVSVPGFKPTASVDVDSTKTDKDKLAMLEKIVYGSTEADARLPLPAEIIELVNGTTQAAG